MSLLWQHRPIWEFTMKRRGENILALTRMSLQQYGTTYPGGFFDKCIIEGVDWLVLCHHWTNKLPWSFLWSLGAGRTRSSLLGCECRQAWAYITICNANISYLSPPVVPSVDSHNLKYFLSLKGPSLSLMWDKLHHFQDLNYIGTPFFHSLKPHKKTCLSSAAKELWRKKNCMSHFAISFPFRSAWKSYQ